MLKFFAGFATLLLAFIPIQAQAYIGPGMGLGAAAIVLGLFVAFIFLLVGLIWLPIRRMLGQRKKSNNPKAVQAAPNSEPPYL